MTGLIECFFAKDVIPGLKPANDRRKINMCLRPKKGNQIDNRIGTWRVCGKDGEFVDGSCFINMCALSFLAAGQ